MLKGKNKVVNEALRLGYQCEEYKAKTGSRYVEFIGISLRRKIPVKLIVRFSNHPPDNKRRNGFDMSVSPDDDNLWTGMEYTEEDVIKKLCELIEVSPTHGEKLAKARKAKKKKKRKVKKYSKAKGKMTT